MARTLIDGSHHEARLSDRERKTVQLWIESGAVYPGTYDALGSGVYTVKFPEAPLHQALCNLDRPKRSLLLRAPLGNRAGGLQLCGQPVFEDPSDPDYQEILEAVRDAAERLANHKRFDMPGFRPNRFHIREMQNFGILPKSLPDDTPVDTYAVDRAYWDSSTRFGPPPAFLARCGLSVHRTKVAACVSASGYLIRQGR